MRQAAAVLFGAADAGADLQHFGRGNAFRIGKVGAGHQRAPQRHRIHDAEDAADADDRDRQPVREAGPPADHDQAGQDEDDRRQRSRRRGDGLDDIVFLDGRVAEGLEHGHRDDGGRDRGREGEADLEARDRRWPR